MKLKRKNSQGIWESVAPSQKEFDDFKSDSTVRNTEIVTSIEKKIEILSTSPTYTVGETGDFSTINAALKELSHLAPEYNFNANNVKVELLLKSGFVMKEQVFINGLNLSYINIRSEDAEVTIDRQFLTVPLGSVARYPAWAFTDGAISPRIYVLFNMNSTGVADQRNGFNVRLGSTGLLQPGSGCKNAFRGLHIANGTAYANGTNFSGSLSVGVRCANSGELWAESVNVSGSDVGFLVDEAYVAARFAIANNCVKAVRAVRSEMDLTGMVADNCGIVIDATEQTELMLRDVVARYSITNAIILQRNCNAYADFSNFSGCQGATPLSINDSHLYLRFGDIVPVGDTAMTATNSEVNITSTKIKRVFVLHGSRVNAKNANVTAYTGASVHFTLSGRGNWVVIEGASATASVPKNVFNASGFVFE